MFYQTQKAARSGQPTLSDERIRAVYSPAALGTPESTTFCATVYQEHRPYFEGVLRRHLQGGLVPVNTSLDELPDLPLQQACFLLLTFKRRPHC